MKFAKFILPYVLISPVSVAVFFIALFVSCIAIEFVMNGMLHALGVFSLVSQTFRNIFVSAAGSGISLIAAALFMNNSIYTLEYTAFDTLHTLQSIFLPFYNHSLPKASFIRSKNNSAAGENT